MSTKPRPYCGVPGCQEVAIHGSRYCEQHRAERRALQFEDRDAVRDSSAKRGYDRAWVGIRARFLGDNPQCSCGQPASVAHHVTPLDRGGSNDPSNLLSLCAACHLKVHPEKYQNFDKTASKNLNVSKRDRGHTL